MAPTRIPTRHLRSATTITLATAIRGMNFSQPSHTPQYSLHLTASQHKANMITDMIGIPELRKIRPICLMPLLLELCIQLSAVSFLLKWTPTERTG
jgi:hypothetical protein